ncbi:MAG: ATP-binding protein, partial [Mycobacteriaceae bacterium]
PRVLSRSGSVAFSRARTARELGTDGPVPTLRLVWPLDEPPAPGADTEVVLPLRAGVDGAALRAAMAGQAGELLLELTGLTEITVDGRTLRRTQRPAGPGLAVVHVGLQRWTQHTSARARWLVRTDGGVHPQGPDVLHAPTRTDEELSLPALLVADLALAPDRRRLLPGTPLDGVAQGYPHLVAALAPEQRTALVPRPGFPRGAVDEELRRQVLAALRVHPWLPSALGGTVEPRQAVVLDAHSPELVAVLADVVPGLIDAELSAPVHTPALAALDVARLGLAGVAEAVAGLRRDPAWWRGLYAALEPLAHDRAALAELAALPVPLTDGRTVLGPRTVTVTDVALGDLPGLRVVHPGAAHPLLVRLGAAASGPSELLADPALAEAVAHADPDDVPAARQLAAAVLRLVAAAGARPGEHSWVGAMLLPDTAGELRAADELLLPGSPLAAVLAEDAPFGTVDAALVAEHGPDVLAAAGVGRGFAVLVDPHPTGADHDLDDEDAWWSDTGGTGAGGTERNHEQPELVAVRDLELVDPRRWPQALTLLHSEPATLAAIRAPGGYTAWWLRRHAELDGDPLGHFRRPDDDTFADLLDPAPLPGLDAALLAGSTVDGPDLAAVLLDRLAEDGRHPSADGVARTWSALARAVLEGRLDPEDVDVPVQVRTRDGAVIDAEDAVILDGACWSQLVPTGCAILGALEPALVLALADLLDVELASERYPQPILPAGAPRAWAQHPQVVLVCAQLGVAVPTGTSRHHDELAGLAWWASEDATVHCTEAGLLPALLHAVSLS